MTLFKNRIHRDLHDLVVEGKAMMEKCDKKIVIALTHLTMERRSVHMTLTYVINPEGFDPTQIFIVSLIT